MVAEAKQRGKVTPEIRAWMEARDADGVPRVEIARQLAGVFGVSVTKQVVSQVLGTRERFRPGTKIFKVHVTPDGLAGARDVAARLGLRISYGSTAGEGSVSALLEAIGRGEVVCRHFLPEAS